MADETQNLLSLFNFALGQVGQSKSLRNTTTDSNSANLLRHFFPIVRRLIFQAAHWGSLERKIALTEKTDPRTPFSHGHIIPDLDPQYLYPRHLGDYGRFMVTGNVLSSNSEAPTLYYTADVLDLSQWEADLYTCVGYALASELVLPLDQKITRARMVIDKANRIILQTQAHQANQQNLMLATQPQGLTARDHAVPAQRERYIYPFGASVGQ